MSSASIADEGTGGEPAGVDAAEFEARIARVREALVERGVGAVVIAPSNDLDYLLGVRMFLLERLAVLVVSRGGEPTMVAPAFEEDHILSAPASVRRRLWSDGDDPFALAVEAIPAADRASIALAGDLPARFGVPLVNRLRAESLVDGDTVLGPLRQLKSPAEVEQMRIAAAATDRALTALLEGELRGATEAELDLRLRAGLTAEGADQARGFAVIGSGPNAALPHHTPDGTVVGDGALLFDVGAPVGSYFTDTTRTVSIGEPDAELATIYPIVLEAQLAAIDAVLPGVTAESIDAAARSVIEEAGYGEYFIHRTGHGIGVDVHEAPYIIRGDETVLQPGHAFTIEPGIYLPGRTGVRIEDIVVVTESGAEVITGLPKQELRVL